MDAEFNEIVLSLCDKTGNIVKPWVEAGYECWIIDIQHQLGLSWEWHGKSNIVKCGEDVLLFSPTKAKYKIIFAQPPCTDLAVSGARWFKEKGLKSLIKALELVEACRVICETLNVPWMLENPIGTLSTYWRKPDFIFDPCDYGDPYTKKTCLWTGNGFKMPMKTPVLPVEGSKMHLLPPSPNRGDIRSVTPPGFAKAVFEANR